MTRVVQDGPYPKTAITTSTICSGIFTNGLCPALSLISFTSTPSFRARATILSCTATGIAASASHTKYSTGTARHAALPHAIYAVCAANECAATSCPTAWAASAGAQSL